MILRHQTNAEFLARFRADYRDAIGERAGRLAQLVLGWLSDGTFADAEVRAAFGQNVAQWAQTKATLTAQAKARADLQNLRGG